LAELPAGLVEYSRTPTFDETTIPAGLLKAHATKPGAWGLIQILEGRLRYVIEDTGETIDLDPQTPGVVVPEQRHHVTPLGQVRFFVAFYR